MLLLLYVQGCYWELYQQKPLGLQYKWAFNTLSQSEWTVFEISLALGPVSVMASEVACFMLTTSWGLGVICEFQRKACNGFRVKATHPNWLKKNKNRSAI